MKRRVGLVLVLLGVSTLIGSGYRFPAGLHNVRLNSGLLMPPVSQVEWWPYVAAALLLGGVMFLLYSHRQETKPVKTLTHVRIGENHLFE